MVLLAIYDAHYNFTTIDTGEYSSNNDGNPDFQGILN